MMGVKKFVKNLIALGKINHEFNNTLNDEIKRLKAQVEEEKKNPKHWKPEW